MSFKALAAVAPFVIGAGFYKALVMHHFWLWHVMPSTGMPDIGYWGALFLIWAATHFGSSVFTKYEIDPGPGGLKDINPVGLAVRPWLHAAMGHLVVWGFA